MDFTRMFEAERDVAREWESGSGTGGGGYRSERRSRFSGRRRKLGWPLTAVGGEQQLTVADDDKLAKKSG